MNEPMVKFHTFFQWFIFHNRFFPAVIHTPLKNVKSLIWKIMGKIMSLQLLRLYCLISSFLFFIVIARDDWDAEEQDDSQKLSAEEEFDFTTASSYLSASSLQFFNPLNSGGSALLGNVNRFNVNATKVAEPEDSANVGDGNGGRDYSNCQMETCFNFDICRTTKKPFKVYVYPVDTLVPKSSTYEKILNSIYRSPYSTDDPTEACIFILSFDTLDRDELSRNFVRNVPARLKNLALWNNGENHIIFNLYAGTWPNYDETELEFDIGKAILAKSSMSMDHFRPNFDIALPLFHSTHPEKGDEQEMVVTNEFPAVKKHLISFKGKRYVYGIGSEVRNSIYHLHNGKDVVFVTTCKHGKNWSEMKDERCDEDNLEYERYDYETLLENSTFCLVPRGRRLGSFRFLEALRAGCIPVLLSNGWVLPFSETIDWPSATISGDERTLLQTLDMLRSIEAERIFFLKQQTQIIYNQYLSSLEKIIRTTLEIMKDRVRGYTWRDRSLWNSSPGALNYDLDYADDVKYFPFNQHEEICRESVQNFTAVIYVQSTIADTKIPGHNAYSNTPLFRLIQSASKSKYISKVLIVWDTTKPIPKLWPEIPIPLTIKRSTSKSVSQRFLTDEIATKAVFSLDEDSVLTTDEFDFAYNVWCSFPDRIIGSSSRSHHWDETRESWRYSSKLTNDYSLILSGGAIYHAYYNHLYATNADKNAQQLVETFQNCEDILLNIISAEVTRKPPIKLIWKKNLDRQSGGNNARTFWTYSDHFKQRQECLHKLFEIYGISRLKRSSVRLDPVLFKDPVSNMRKKYRQLEL